MRCQRTPRRVRFSSVPPLIFRSEAEVAERTPNPLSTGCNSLLACKFHIGVIVQLGGLRCRKPRIWVRFPVIPPTTSDRGPTVRLLGANQGIRVRFPSVAPLSSFPRRPHESSHRLVDMIAATGHSARADSEVGRNGAQGLSQRAIPRELTARSAAMARTCQCAGAPVQRRRADRANRNL